MLIYHTEIINLLFLLFCAQSLKKQKNKNTQLSYPLIRLLRDDETKSNPLLWTPA